MCNVDVRSRSTNLTRNTYFAYVGIYVGISQGCIFQNTTEKHHGFQNLRTPLHSLYNVGKKIRCVFKINVFSKGSENEITQMRIQNKVFLSNFDRCGADSIKYTKLRRTGLKFPTDEK